MSASENQKIDPATVAALYVDYADDLRAFLIGVLRNGDLANEALQATFTKALESGHTARKATLKGWLFRVGYHEALAIRRKQKIQRKSMQKLAWNTNQESEAPEENVSRVETVKRVRAAMERLSEEQRQVVHMRIYEGKTFAVIAEEIGAPLGTVLTRMRLALKKLHREFESKD
ncbi:MAG: sigma-70 family RNA polymerase sigma factor [Planctomycetaceae bacterium]